MLHDNMDLSRLMFDAQQVDEICLMKSNREAKSEKSFGSGSSKSRLDVQDKPKFKKRFSNQVPTNFSKNINDRGSNPTHQKERNVDPPKERPTCGKKHVSVCLVGTNCCYTYGKGGHMVKDGPNVRIKGKWNGHFKPSGSNFESQKRKRFYALKARGEQESSPDVVRICYKFYL